jgi:hypothetical protein
MGRISEVILDEEGAITHVVVEGEGGLLEVPITSLTLDRDADFATFHADASDDEPGDHVGDEEDPEGYAPNESEVEDARHEGQLVTEPEDDEEAQSQADLVREDWEDETHTPVDSGYPRTDAYVDPDTGEEEIDPALNEGNGVEDDVARLVDGTGLRVNAVKDGVVELTGNAASREDLGEVVEEIMGLTDVLEVDTTDVSTG